MRKVGETFEVFIYRHGIYNFYFWKTTGELDYIAEINTPNTQITEKDVYENFQDWTGKITAHLQMLNGDEINPVP